jgi:hypothetical protein
MLTKEELLQKGIPEKTADEIIAAFSDSQDNDSLLALQKALEVSPDTGEDLFKAAKGDDKGKDSDDEDDEDYDEEYMKKYMKRYMKTNSKSVHKMMKDIGLLKDDMKKAMDDISDPDSPGGIVEMDDLAPYLEKQAKFNECLLKALETLSGQNVVISESMQKAFDLVQKSAKVTADQAVQMKEFLNTPAGRKGKIATDIDMKKANEGIDPKTVFSAEDNKAAHRVLMKATQEKHTHAGMVISSFEAANHNANLLNSAQKQFIRDLIAKEAK